LICFGSELITNYLKCYFILTYIISEVKGNLLYLRFPAVRLAGGAHNGCENESILAGIQ